MNATKFILCLIGSFMFIAIMIGVTGSTPGGIFLAIFIGALGAWIESYRNKLK